MAVLGKSYPYHAEGDIIEKGVVSACPEIRDELRGVRRDFLEENIDLIDLDFQPT